MNLRSLESTVKLVLFVCLFWLHYMIIIFESFFILTAFLILKSNRNEPVWNNFSIESKEIFKPLICLLSLSGSIKGISYVQLDFINNVRILRREIFEFTFYILKKCLRIFKSFINLSNKSKRKFLKFLNSCFFEIIETIIFYQVNHLL